MANNKHIPKEDVLRLYDSGKTRQEIASIMGCSKTTISNILLSMGRRSRTIDRHRSYDQAIDMLRRGGTAYRVARTLGIPSTSLYSHAQRAGLDYLNSQASVLEHRRKLYDTIRQLYDAGYTVDYICAQVGLSRVTVTQRLRDMGYTNTRPAYYGSIWRDGHDTERYAKAHGLYKRPVADKPAIDRPSCKETAAGIQYKRPDYRTEEDVMDDIINGLGDRSALINELNRIRARETTWTRRER